MHTVTAGTKVIYDVSVKECQDACLLETSFECKAIDYDSYCYLQMKNMTEPGVRIH